MNRTASFPTAGLAPAPRRPAPRRAPGFGTYLAAIADGMAAILDLTGEGVRGRAGRFLSGDPQRADARALRRDFEAVVARYEPLLHPTDGHAPDGESAPQTK